MEDAPIVVIDPDDTCRGVLVRGLHGAGLAAVGFARGERALEAAAARPGVVIVTELNVPDVPGIEICRRVRATPQLADVRLLVLTGAAEEIDRVVAFEVGADDFVTKPYSMRELVLRLRRLRRRPTGNPVGDSLAFGVDTTRMEAQVNGRAVRLTPTEARLLAALARRRGALVPAEVLIEEVWGEPEVDAAQRLRTCVQRLRERLGDDAALVRTVRGRGYCLDRRWVRDGRGTPASPDRHAAGER